MTDDMRLQMLQWRDGILDLVIDTDAATEVDDPFAIAYVLLSPERFRVRAIYAAPFAMNERAQDPAVGMEMSYQEILRVMELCHCKKRCPVFYGAEGWLTRQNAERLMAARLSDAAADLCKRAMTYTSDAPLYILALGAGTNLAQALSAAPEIAERIVIVWLAGNDFSDSPNTYNIYQDVRAAQIIFDSGVPLLHVPCNPVTSHMLTSVPELNAWIGGKNALCEYLVQNVYNYGSGEIAWSKTIWDLGAAGICYKEEWSRREYTTAPIITDQITWSRNFGRHLIANVRELDRDHIFRDAFLKYSGL